MGRWQVEVVGTGKWRGQGYEAGHHKGQVTHTYLVVGACGRWAVEHEEGWHIKRAGGMLRSSAQANGEGGGTKQVSVGGCKGQAARTYHLGGLVVGGLWGMKRGGASVGVELASEKRVP